MSASATKSPIRRSLRATLGENEKCDQLLAQAQALAENLFDLKKPPSPKSVIPFFTQHDTEHLRTVEHLLDQILFDPHGKPLKGESCFVPSPEEAMYLLAGAWLHDIGMIAGIFPNEAVGPDTDWRRIRDEHEFRTSEYIQYHWHTNSDWAPEQRVALAQLCIYHRRKHPLREMQPASFQGFTGSNIRLRELAALLRLADACHLDASRAPGDFKNMYTAIGMPIDSVPHWGMPQFVNRIAFDHDKKVIRLHCLIPPKAPYGTVTVDFIGVVRQISRGLREELRSAEPYLIRFSNTAFKEIKLKVDRPAAMRDPSKQMREMWPYLLSSHGSASEVACMVAALARAMIVTDPISKGELEQFLQRALKVHPFNFLVRKLVHEIRGCVLPNNRAEELREHLLGYLALRKNVSVRLADTANEALPIDAEDWLVIHGFSHSVLSFLKKHHQGHHGKLLVVECTRDASDHHMHDDDSSRFVGELTPLGFDCHRIKLESLPIVFARRQSQRKPAVRVLLGARGITGDGRVLSIVGSALLAMTAKKYAGTVHILADVDKRCASDDGEAKEIEEQIERFVRDIVASPNGLDSMRPQIDVLDASMYDGIVYSDAPTIKNMPAKSE